MKKVYILLLIVLPYYAFSQPKTVVKVLKSGIITNAQLSLKQEPVTVTASIAKRSAGGIHDFYSEGDYWWPDSENPDGPYIRRDGETNPENFTAHRHAMIRFSQVVGSLTSAYLIEPKVEYLTQIKNHLNAWFVNEDTKMNPSLLYAQAIKGRVTGRGIGIIDMIQMMEVAQSVRVLEQKGALSESELVPIKACFDAYLEWITTHPYGIDERDTKNNHATCWVMQVATFARLTNNVEVLDYCKKRFKTVLLPNQMAQDGSFPLELERTKPYGYALFNTDAMVAVAHILSDEKESLWDFELSDGRTIKKAIEFMHPYVADKSKWTYPKDVMYDDNWPIAQPFLILGYYEFGNKQWLNTWKKLEHFPEVDEVIRNLPIRNPLIWLVD
ncbi:Alginate lyase [Spirosomataceae bacterium TFI 002]|nr:Alginate lyase [Spirosomataceae bacterium TFI 002]